MIKWKMFKQKEKDKTKNSGVSGRKNKKWQAKILVNIVGFPSLKVLNHI